MYKQPEFTPSKICKNVANGPREMLRTPLRKAGIHSIDNHACLI